jgi:hypothetical protein
MIVMMMMMMNRRAEVERERKRCYEQVSHETAKETKRSREELDAFESHRYLFNRYDINEYRCAM